MEDELKPSVAGMLQVGYACGLSTLNEAYSQYMHHYDCFFLIDKFHEQNAEFTQQLKDLGFVKQVDGFNELIDINLEACAKIVGIILEEYIVPDEQPKESECPVCPLDELSVPLSATERADK